jgi:hypothetical protein
MNFSFQRGAEVKNRSIITTPKSDDRHKNKKNKNTHIIVKSIHHSVQNLKYGNLNNCKWKKHIICTKKKKKTRKNI